MNNTTSKVKTSIIGIKEFITTILLTVIFIVAQMVLSPLFLTNVTLTYTVMPGIMGIILGIPYVLMVSKSRKRSTILLMFSVYGIFYLSFGMPIIGITLLVLGIFAELSMLGNGYYSRIRPIIPFTMLLVFSAFGPLYQLFFFKDSMIQVYAEMGLTDEAAQQSLDMISALYFSPVNMMLSLVLTIAGSFVGYFIGTKVLKKHFAPAGIA